MHRVCLWTAVSTPALSLLLAVKVYVQPRQLPIHSSPQLTSIPLAHYFYYHGERNHPDLDLLCPNQWKSLPDGHVHGCQRTVRSETRISHQMADVLFRSGPNSLAAYRLAAANTGPSQIGSLVSGGILANSTNATVTAGSPGSTATSTLGPTQSTGAASALQAAEWAAIGGAFLFGGLLL